MINEQRIKLFGIDIDPVTMNEATDRVMDIVHRPAEHCSYVVTPNLDHAVQYQESQELREAYRDASLIFADGAPLIWASRWLGVRLPERVAGADLTPALFEAAKKERPLRVFLLGAAEGVAERAADNIHKRWPAVEVIGTYSPPLGFEKDEEENNRILEMVKETTPDVLVVGLGAPKQEFWVHCHRESIHASVALCVGASIDFLAGEKPRAPKWMRKVGLEWLHRMASEPRRLFARYMKDAWHFPQLVWRQAFDGPKAFPG